MDSTLAPERTAKFRPRAPDVPPQPRYRRSGIEDLAFWMAHDVVLPEGEIYKRLWDEAQALGIEASTAAGVTHRAIDAPVTGQVAVHPRDEREAKYEKPLLYMDMDGSRPIIAVGGGEYHTGDLKDLVDEARHYGDDQVELPERRNILDVFEEKIERLERRRLGKRTYGPGRGQRVHLNSDGR